MGRVGSYPTFSPLLREAQRYISVALVLRLPSAGVTRYPCPVEPGLSSPAAFRPAAAAVQPGCLHIVQQNIPIVKYLANSFGRRYTISRGIGKFQFVVHLSLPLWGRWHAEGMTEEVCRQYEFA